MSDHVCLYCRGEFAEPAELIRHLWEDEAGQKSLVMCRCCFLYSPCNCEGDILGVGGSGWFCTTHNRTIWHNP